MAEEHVSHMSPIESWSLHMDFLAMPPGPWMYQLGWRIALARFSSYHSVSWSWIRSCHTIDFCALMMTVWGFWCTHIWKWSDLRLSCSLLYFSFSRQSDMYKYVYWWSNDIPIFQSVVSPRLWIVWVLWLH